MWKGIGLFSKTKQQDGPVVPRRHIVIPVDDSPTSENAFDFALQRLVQPTHVVSIVSVDDTGAGPYPAEFADAPDLSPLPSQFSDLQREQEQAAEHANEILRKYQARCRQAGLESQCLVRELRPKGTNTHKGVANTILDYAEKVNAEAVVVGSRGMGGMNRALMNMMGLGSVSDYVLTHAKCPVIVVKTNEKETGGEQGGSQ